MVDLPISTWLAAAMAFVAVALGTVSARARPGVVSGGPSQEARAPSAARLAVQGVDGGDAGICSWRSRAVGRPMASSILGTPAALAGYCADAGAGGLGWTHPELSAAGVLGWGVGMGAGRLTVTGSWYSPAASRRWAPLPVSVDSQQAEAEARQVRGSAARGHRSARARDPRGASALFRARHGLPGVARPGRKPSSGAPSRSSGSAFPWRIRCSPWPIAWHLSMCGFWLPRS